MCSLGRCVCGTGELFCESRGLCTDVQENDLHCGMCDNECPPSSECNGGSCQCFLSTETPCPGGCADLGADEQNCGSCGVVCDPGMTCSDGLCLCPAPIAGVFSEYRSTPLDGQAWAALGDGRIVVVGRINYSNDRQVLLLVLNADGTVAASEVIAYRNTTAGAGFVSVLAAAWDGTTVGILFSEEVGGMAQGYFMRTLLDGTQVTAPIRIDEDRGTGEMLPTGGMGTPRHALFYDPVAGFTALTMDYRDYDSFGREVGWSVYSRSLGLTGSTLGPSRRLHYEANPYHYQIARQQYPDGTIDVLAPGLATSAIRLDAQGGPRSSTLLLDGSTPWEDYAHGIARAAGENEYLIGRGNTTVPSASWFHGADHGSSTPVTATFDLQTSADLYPHPSGTVAAWWDAGRHVRRIRRIGPGDWERMDADGGVVAGFASDIVPTGPLTALVLGVRYVVPIQFADCP